MDLTAHKNRDYTMDDIYTDLKLLKLRINYLVDAEGGMTMDDRITKNIKVLVKKNKRLSEQHKEIQREIQYCERIYEEALIKIVKAKKTEIEQDKKKLEDLKEKCKKLDVQVDVLSLNVQDTKTEKPKSTDVTVRDVLPSLNVQTKKTKRPKKSIVVIRNKIKKAQFKGRNTSIKDKIKIKIRQNSKSKKRNLSRILKEKNTRINDKIKIKIQRNKKSGGRELFFLNDSKTKQAFSNLVKKKENNPSNFRECRIILKKLTKEQAKLYTKEQRLIEQQKNQQISQESSPQNNRNKSPITKPNWHIRIPRSVFEESQQEIQNLEFNVSDNTANVKRTRSFKR